MIKNLLIPVSLLALVASSATLADGLTCHTQKRTVVVDLNRDGQPRYRAWNAPHTRNQPPDLLILGGTHDIEGTGPCAHAVWSFDNGNTRYTVSQLGCTEEQPPAGATGQLSVYINDRFQQSWWCF